MAKAKKTTEKKAAKTGPKNPVKAISPTELLKRSLALMEDDTRISVSAGKDFMESLEEAISRALDRGEAVSVAKCVKLNPVGLPKRLGRNPQTGETKMVPAGTKVKASVLKRAKESAPGKGTAMGKSMIAYAQEKYEAAVARREARLAEEAKEAKKTEKAGKAEGTKKSSGKKTKK